MRQFPGITLTIERTSNEGGSGDDAREGEVKYSSSDSVVGAKKGLLSECRRGSVFERINSGFNAAVCSPGQPPPPHVSCRRSGLEDDLGAVRGKLAVLDELFNTTSKQMSATMTRYPILAPTVLYYVGRVSRGSPDRSPETSPSSSSLSVRTEAK